MAQAAAFALRTVPSGETMMRLSVIDPMIRATYSFDIVVSASEDAISLNATSRAPISSAEDTGTRRPRSPPPIRATAPFSRTIGRTTRREIMKGTPIAVAASIAATSPADHAARRPSAVTTSRSSPISPSSLRTRSSASRMISRNRGKASFSYRARAAAVSRASPRAAISPIARRSRRCSSFRRARPAISGARYRLASGCPSTRVAQF